MERKRVGELSELLLEEVQSGGIDTHADDIEELASEPSHHAEHQPTVALLIVCVVSTVLCFITTTCFKVSVVAIWAGLVE